MFMRITDHPFFTRPGFKLKEKGPSALGTDELLAIIFWTGTKDQDVLEISNRLLKKYNLSKLATCSLNELKNECDNSEIKALKILSLFELIKRYNKLKEWGFKTSISSAQDVFNLFRREFENEKQEHFVVLLLDTKNRILNYDKKAVTKGLLNSSLVHPREVFRFAIKEGANSVILVHNHPSGDCSPSSEDEQITDKFREAGELIGIKVLDHVIVGKNKHFSFKEDSLI